MGRIPLPRRAKRRIEIRRAAVGVSEDLRAFVDRESRHLQFAPVFDQATWQRRIESWPGFGIDSFLVATESNGRIIGCLAPWDASAISRIVIDGLPPAAELLRRAVNVTSFVTRRPVIPVGAAGHVPDVALTHVRIADRDPAVFLALLSAAYRELIAAGKFATMSFCLYDEDPLWRALRFMIYNSVSMDLYWTLLDGGAAPPRRHELWPGFEPYLV